MKIKKKKRVIIYVIVCLVLITFLSIIMYLKNANKDEFSEFDNKFNIYGLNTLYNNKEIKPNEKVTKLEAIKVVIAATNNTLDIGSLFDNKDSNDETSKVLNYAYASGIVSVDELDGSNCNSNAKIIDLVKYISRAKYYILKKDYLTIGDINIRDYNKYKEDEKVNIIDLLASEILENNKKLNGNKPLTKSKCSELIVKYIQKYNLLSVFGRNILTNSESFPKNAEDYPYLVTDVEKEVYEQAYTKTADVDFLNPADFYVYRKDYYENTIKRAEDYYNSILNVSYENINYDDMYKKLSDLVVSDINKEELNEYIEYVKQNNIILTGKATAQVPCIYNDGSYCRIRLKLEFDIKNSLTRENLIYMDENSINAKIYNNDKYTIYIDAKMGYVFNSRQVYVSQQDIYSMLLDISKNQIIIK